MRARFTLTLVLVATVAAVAPATATARYEGRVRSTHPGTILDKSRNWTYRGDTVDVSFRNTSLAAGKRQSYRVCYTRGVGVRCQARTLRGAARDWWRLRILPPWAGYVAGRYVRYVVFTWRISGRVVAQQRIWIYE